MRRVRNSLEELDNTPRERLLRRFGYVLLDAPERFQQFRLLCVEVVEVARTL